LKNCSEIENIQVFSKNENRKKEKRKRQKYQKNKKDNRLEKQKKKENPKPVRTAHKRAGPTQPPLTCANARQIGLPDDNCWNVPAKQIIT
jgi:hypothetical protein